MLIPFLFLQNLNIATTPVFMRVYSTNISRPIFYSHFFYVLFYKSVISNLINVKLDR